MAAVTEPNVSAACSVSGAEQTKREHFSVPLIFSKLIVVCCTHATI